MFPNNAVENVLKRFQTDMELRVGVPYFADLSQAFDYNFCSLKLVERDCTYGGMMPGLG
jgi:hypothetical protein